MSFPDSLRWRRCSGRTLALVMMTASLLLFFLLVASLQSHFLSGNNRTNNSPILHYKGTQSASTLVPLHAANPQNTTSDDDREAALPVYLRGIGWPKVEDLLEQDLRISTDIIPIHYSINLSVDVRGYNGANISTFQGNVTIDMNITTDMRGIELHSVGLEIVESILYLPGNAKRLRTIGGSVNSHRETIVLFPDTDFSPTTARLKITYSGRSYRNRYGLFETWSRMGGESPRIALVTLTSPTGARYWFPSFDQPNMKATFQLTVDHPTSLNAFSNTRNLTSIEVGYRTRTVFAQTPILPTYLVALALNDLPSKSMSYSNHTVRVLGPGAELALNQSRQALEKLWNDKRFAGVPFLSDKTDIMIIEDIDIALEYPGMIIIAAGAMEHAPELIEHEFLHMYFGNLMTPTTFDDSWISEGFAEWISGSRIFDADQEFSSIHESPVRKERRFADSVSSMIHLFDPNISYIKSAQILDITHRMNQHGFWNNTKNILHRHSFGNIDGPSLFNEITVGLNETNEERLRQLITQPGKVLIIVKRGNGTIEIEKMRYHTSFFDSGLRHTSTPLSLPLIYYIDGNHSVQWLDTTKSHFTIPVPNNASISIETKYWCLLDVIYEMPVVTVEEARRSILAAASIGYFTFDKLVDNIRLNAHLFTKAEFGQLIVELWRIIIQQETQKRELHCKTNDMADNLSVYKKDSLDQSVLLFTLYDHPLLENLICGFSNSSDYERFLHNTFLDNSPILRGRDLIWLLVTAEQSKFPGVFADFFFNVYAKSPNPFMSYDILEVFIFMFVDKDITDREAEQAFRSHTTLAASLSEKVVVALEKHYVMKQRMEFFNVSLHEFQAAFEPFGTILKD